MINTAELTNHILKMLPGETGASYGVNFQFIYDNIHPKYESTRGFSWTVYHSIKRVLTILEDQNKIVRFDNGHEYRFFKKNYSKRWGKP